MPRKIAKQMLIIVSESPYLVSELTLKHAYSSIPYLYESQFCLISQIRIIK